jgi:hypothetical protein
MGVAFSNVIKVFTVPFGPSEKIHLPGRECNYAPIIGDRADEFNLPHSRPGFGKQPIPLSPFLSPIDLGTPLGIEAQWAGGFLAGATRQGGPDSWFWVRR